MNKNLKYPVFECTLDETEQTGVYCISLVDRPAVECDFLCFSDDTQTQLFSADDERHIVSGIAMRADHPIIRKDADGKLFYVYFSKETVRHMQQKFFAEGHQFNISVEHEIPVDNCYVMESFIIDRARGIDPKEFSQIEDGSWYVSVKIDNEDVWNVIKTTGCINGFSVEVASKAVQKMSSEQTNKSLITNILKGKLN